MLRKAVAFLEVSGDVEVVASAAAVIVHNIGKAPVSFATGGKSLNLRAGQMARIR